MAHTARLAIPAAIALSALGTAAALGCSNEPRSGRYCDTQRASECVWVDLEHQIVTFYDEGRPVDVSGTLANGLIATQPKTGPFKGKTVRLSFDASKPKHVALEVQGTSETDGPTRRLLYALE